MQQRQITFCTIIVVASVQGKRRGDAAAIIFPPLCTRRRTYPSPPDLVQVTIATIQHYLFTNFTILMPSMHPKTDWERTVYISWLKSYATAKEILIHIALSEFSQIYSTFMILILIIISITIIVIITIIINRTKDDSWDMNGNFISWQVLENKVQSPVCKKKEQRGFTPFTLFQR